MSSKYLKCKSGFCALHTIEGAHDGEFGQNVYVKKSKSDAVNRPQV